MTTCTDGLRSSKSPQHGNVPNVVLPSLLPKVFVHRPAVTVADPVTTNTNGSKYIDRPSVYASPCDAIPFQGEVFILPKEVRYDVIPFRQFIQHILKIELPFARRFRYKHPHFSAFVFELHTVLFIFSPQAVSSLAALTVVLPFWT